MNEEEKKKRLETLERELGVVRKLSAGLAEDLKKETEPLRKEDLDAQLILVNRQVSSIEKEIAELKNAPKDRPQRVRSVFGRR